MPEVWVTVTESQVFNWIKLVNTAGISTDCISVSNKKSSAKEIERFKKSLGGDFFEINFKQRLIITDIVLILNLLKHYFKNVFKYKKIIFQTRMPTAGISFSALRWLPKARFIFEARAAANEESTHIDSNKKPSLKLKIKNNFSVTNERKLIKKTDRVFCVSNALKDYYKKKYEIKKDKFSVFPGAADSELFFYDENLRNSTRKDLNLDPDDILVVYSGRLEMKWEIPDKIINFFKDLNSKDSKFKLLLVTPDVELANDLINEKDLKDLVYVKKVELIDVNKYLNAADIGLLLREDIPMNNVASPTKFAEYLMAGLPVIVSHGVYDFANDIDKTGYGTVVSGLDNISQKEHEKLLKSLALKRRDIATWGNEKLSKEAFIQRYVRVLENV